ncbi:MAG TPA: AI-2E family transporter [Thermoanaerobaculia bacterium]|nr:AI-2E family transporter [Thermoanaerobaculia bacterium]
MEIRSSVALRVTAIVFGVLIALQFLWIARSIFIVTFLGVLLGLAMARAVDYLERIHIRRGLGAALVLLALIGTVAGIFALIGPSIREQSRELTRELPKAMRSIEAAVNRTPMKALVSPPPMPQQQQQQQPQRGEPAKSQGPEKEKQQQGGLTDRVARELRGATQFLFPIVSSFLGAVGGIVIVLFIAMYIAAEPGLYRKGILHLIPHRQRDRAEEWLSTLRDTLRQWLLARLIAMVLIGLITGAGLAALGVKGAAALAVLAGLLEFVPFFGPIASAIPAIGVALVDSPSKALWVVGLYLLIQQLEGNVITPLLLEKRLDVPPVMTVVAVAALGMVFGVLGMLIAEPLLAAVLVTIKMLYVTDVVGDEVQVGKEKS